MTTTVCEHCGVFIGEPHQRLPTDCTLEHPGHEEARYGRLCARHWHWLLNTLTEIGQLWPLLADVIVPGPASESRVATRVGSPAPGRVDVMALTDPRSDTPSGLEDVDDIPDVPGTLASWARRVKRERRTTDQLVGNVPVHVSLRVLRRERHYIANQPWITTLHDDLETVHRHVARAVGDSMFPRPIGKCPNDGAPLFNTIGVDEVTCRRCKSSWSGVHLLRLRLIFEQQSQ